MCEFCGSGPTCCVCGRQDGAEQLTAETLAELDAIHASMMAQPGLSDSVPDGERWHWVFGDEVARIAAH